MIGGARFNPISSVPLSPPKKEHTIPLADGRERDGDLARLKHGLRATIHGVQRQGTSSGSEDALQSTTHGLNGRRPSRRSQPVRGDMLHHMQVAPRNDTAEPGQASPSPRPSP
jgi:hypothetical protein